jgi:hypothetical protein
MVPDMHELVVRATHYFDRFIGNAAQGLRDARI